MSERGSIETKKNIYPKKIGPSEDWSHICPLIERCLCCWIGVEKCSIGGLSFQFWLDISNPPQIFNGDQIVLQPNPTIGPSFCCQHQRNYETSPPRAFRENLYQFLWDGAEAVITRGWILRKPILYSWMPSPSRACWRPVRGRMSENRTFSGSHARQQVLSRGGERVHSVWSTSGHICDKCWQALEWVRWHFWADCSVVQLYVKDRRPLSVVSNPGPARSFLLNLVNCTESLWRFFSTNFPFFCFDKW